MFSNVRRTFVFLLFVASATAAPLAWAGHGHGHGGGHWGGGGWSGGHGHVSYGHWGGGYSGWSGNWGGARFYSGYRNYGWPYGFYRNNFYRPYAYGFFGYPYLYSYFNYPSLYDGYPSYYYSYPGYYSYPSDYYANGNEYYGEAPSVGEYVVSRPVQDVARVEIRLPDPQGTLWVQGQQIPSNGTVRKFRSPQLDPSRQYTYTMKAEWKDSGKVVTDERQVKVQANSLAVVDFNPPRQGAPATPPPALPDLPPPQPRPTVE